MTSTVESQASSGPPPELSRPSPTGGDPIPLPSGTTAAELEGMVERARRAQRLWGQRSLDERIRVLSGTAKRLLRHRNEVVRIFRHDIGKLECEALMTEALPPVDQLSAWASVVRQHCRRRKVWLNPISFPNK